MTSSLPSLPALPPPWRIQTPADAALELLWRRAAAESFLAFNHYIAWREAPRDDDGNVLEAPELPAAHHVLLCQAVQHLVDGEFHNLMVLMPPGSAKSTYCTVRLPAWYIGKFRRRGVVSASYNDELAEMFGGKVRTLVQSEAYRAVFPFASLTADTRAKGEWNTANGGFYFAVGVGGGVTGRRGDLGIADDLIKGRQDADSATIRNKTWQWWLSEFRTRLKPRTARRVQILTRWHEDDVAGRILPENYAGESGLIRCRDGADWMVLNLPAQARLLDPLGRAPGEWLWPEYFSPAYWEAERAAQTMTGTRNWQSLYQQVPTADDGTYFRKEWVRRYTDLPKHLSIYMSGDFAVSEGRGDFTELAVWGVDEHRRVYALDWWSGQRDVENWTPRFVALVERWQPFDFTGESGVIRRAVESGLRNAMRDAGKFTTLNWLATSADKPAMAQTFRGLMENGVIHFPNTDWADRVVDQLMKFPGGRYDDAVDACSLFGRHIHKVWGATVPQEKPDPSTLFAQATGEMRVADFMAPPTRNSEW